MKSIELTEEHKSKLLEMCEKLFPEFMNVTVKCTTAGMLKKYTEHIKWTAGKKLAFPYKDVGNIDSFINYYEIDWFEFCMTYLTYKLSYEFSKLKISSGKAIHIELWELNKGDYFEKHPIDYLYEEFKKLK